MDVITGIEPGADWTISRQLGGEAYHDLFDLREDKKSICAHNETKQISKSQYVGTCTMAVGVFSNHIKNVDLNPDKYKDRQCLGSYCSLVTTGKSTKPMRIVTYYRPNNESMHKAPNRGRQTVFMQHIREFKQQWLLRKDPRLKADRYLIKDLNAWKIQGEETILLGDYNQSIYKSQLATALTGPALNMRGQ